MNDNLKDILSNLNKDIEQEKLLEYLNKQLPAREAHDMEAQMLDDPFMNDAIEGLSEFNNKADLPSYVQQLNQNLQKQLSKKKARKEKRRIKDQPWVYFTIILILVLLIISYVLIKKHGDAKKDLPPKTSFATTVISKK